MTKWLLAKLVSGKGVAFLGIIIGSLVFGMWTTIKAKNFQINSRDKKIAKYKTKVEKLDIKVSKLESTISNYKESQKTNLTAIDELQSALQQCAQSRELNEQNATEQTRLQNGRIADIERRNDELRKKLPKFGCAATNWDGSILEQLRQD